MIKETNHEGRYKEYLECIQKYAGSYKILKQINEDSHEAAEGILYAVEQLASEALVK